MLTDNIDNSEYLYRGVICSPNACNIEVTPPRYSSSIFKDSNGVSVDRVGDRSENEVIAFMLKSSFNRNNPFRAILKFSVSDCIALGVIVLAKPLPNNENDYHAEVHQSNTVIKLTDGQAKRLSQRAVAVYHNNENCSA